ncbi:MAG TPA: L-serine ammonia-lyase, iron-sulfur-dependent, subunit alpha [Eubacteriales bacterium]|nr:L-serine ammonia-lyase, iron-sulfur-dependent, subunit alpha [Clostridia bacterium]HRV73744.1 L-serine ammonia-lyase, iron-sulfur-dependent, subunit alpha [Eubacteriales bacterium]
MDKELIAECREILEYELIMATGCTEPIAVAYASALAREALGVMPEKLRIGCSGNIIKNVKSVVVPGTNGMKGIGAAAVIGAVGGDPKLKLDVLSGITEEHCIETKKLLDKKICTVYLLESDDPLCIRVDATAGDDCSVVEIKGDHTNVVLLEKNGRELRTPDRKTKETHEPDYSVLSIARILDYAEVTDLSFEAPILERQIECNSNMAQEGLQNDWGMCIGKLLMDASAETSVQAKAMAAAGSDARMSGCLKPVVINSGSGNQGLTVSLPVIQYAKCLNADHEKLLRALLISNLCSIHIKHRIGRLSAFCGAVSAACGAGAAITWLEGGSREQINASIANTLANVSGIVCDGAKPSCAAKIASALDAALMAHRLAMRGRQFAAGDGLIAEDIEDTITKVGELGREGMKETDREILRLMLDE